jgi:hypothetical protein
MDQKDFVSQSLTQIVEGVREARQLAGKWVAQVVHFDVALTVTSGIGTKGGIGIAAELWGSAVPGNRRLRTPL